MCPAVYTRDVLCITADILLIKYSVLILYALLRKPLISPSNAVQCIM